MAEYIFKSKLFTVAGKGNIPEKPKLVMDFCDVDSDKWLQYSEEASFPLQQVYKSEYERLQAYERKVYLAFDASFLVSKQEKILFLKTFPEAPNLTVITNGVDTTYFSPDSYEQDSNVKQQPALVFTGAMDYHANIDGVCWFCQDIFPELKKRFSELQFYIVGRHPTSAVKKLADIQGVIVTGNVNDVRPWYKKADIVVVPLRLARGVQNKVLEAMAIGRPVVSTSKANFSINAKDGEHILLADTADDFVNTISALLANQDKQEKLSENARDFVLQNYDWNRNLAKLEALLP
jgi:sugar transferase (PEP-CTERM/EpsH1 system associated)